MIRNPAIDEFIEKQDKWKDELSLLREIILECGLTEEYKWRGHCYSFQNSNLLIIGGFKEHCVLSYFKGVLLNDEAKLLVKPGENSQSGRFLKFKSVNEILQLKDLIKAYIFEAIELEKAGVKVEFTESKEFDLPEELLEKFKVLPELKVAFENLTIGRQRAYVIHFNGTKQSKTKTARIEKYIPRILSGKGFNDCVCGLSKKMPGCDGSHKFLKTQ
jgi:uncharacterized protein YdeI (YjbR/CyaY-like superfamily)